MLSQPKFKRLVAREASFTTKSKDLVRFLLTGGNLEVSINGTFGKTLQVLRVDGDHSGRVSDQDDWVAVVPAAFLKIIEKISRLATVAEVPVFSFHGSCASEAFALVQLQSHGQLRISWESGRCEMTRLPSKHALPQIEKIAQWLANKHFILAAEDTSASEVHLQSLKALADVAHGVSLAVPRGAQGYALALCLAQILELQRPLLLVGSDQTTTPAAAKAFQVAQASGPHCVWACPDAAHDALVLLEELLQAYRAARPFVHSLIGGFGVLEADLREALESAVDFLQSAEAMDVSSRGQRANDLLSITVGTQSISPFYWSIDSGALVCAQTILEDLLTIRADRDVYYYGCDNLFTRHPEVIKRICVSAPSLLPTLLDGLVWRSRQTKEGMRRVNYYVKHLIQDLEGNFSPNLECLVTHRDPNTIRHPTVVLFADILWHKVASFKFVVSKLFSVFILIVFIFGQAVLLRHNTEQAPEEEYAMFACRVVNYVGSLSKLVFSQLRKFFSDLQNRDYRWICGIPVPAYLFNIQDAASCCLMWLLVIMAMQEPFFWCLSDGQGLTQMCQEGEVRKDFYSACTFLAMILYWALLMDLAIFSMRISAYVLVCGRVTGEVALFLSALLLLLLAFSTAISSLYLEMPSKAGALVWLEELTSMSLRMYPQEHYQVLVATSTIITVPVCIFLFIVTIFLMNLLVAQLTQSYHDAFSNMQGYARLNRASVTAVTIANVSRKRWARFIQIMAFDEPMEFNEGDVGLSGGIQVLEPSNEHLVTEDSIKRFGGSTAPTAPWPQTQVPEEEQDKIALLEKKLMKIIKVSSSKHNRGGSTTGSSMSGASGAGTSSAIDSS